MENQVFEVKERKVLKTIPIWFMIICGVFYACQLIMFSVNKTPFYIYSTPINFNLLTFGYLMIGASVFILILLFALYSYSALIFKISCLATCVCSFILAIPFNASFLEIAFYAFTVFFQFTVLSLIMVTLKQFSVTSIFKNCYISLISGCGIYAIFLLTNLQVYAPVFMITMLVCIGLFLGSMKLFNNKQVIDKTPRITRIFSDKEKKHNPYLSKKQTLHYPIKTSFSILLLVIASSVIYFINDLKITSLNMPSWVFYACACLGAIIFGIVFKFTNKNIFKAILIYLGVAFLGTIFLFIEIKVLEIVGACLFASSLMAFSLNTFYASILFAEVPTKLIVFSTLALQVIANLLTTSLLNNLGSNIVVMAITLLIIGLVVFLLLFAMRYINQIWTVSLSPSLVLNDRLKETLTQTELLIFELMVLGYSKKQISSILYLRIDAINTHIASIISKIWSNGLSDKYMKSFKTK